MNTTAETVSSCVKFAASLKTAVGFAVLASEGAAIREGIENGRWEGISFPNPPKKKREGSASPYTRDQQRGMVSAIHSLRRDGLKARDAAIAVGIAYQTYLRYVTTEDMPYEGPCLRGNFKRCQPTQ